MKHFLRHLTAGLSTGALLTLAACADGTAPNGAASAAPIAVTDIGSSLLENGLAATAQGLQGTKGADARFAQGAVQTLQAIEHILQVRYAHYTDDLPFIPGGEVEIPPNPDGTFDPKFVDTALLGALAHFKDAQANLAAASGEDFAVEFDLNSVWFDINANGAYDPFESGLNIVISALDVPVQPKDMMRNTVVRFDTADADWLAAYVHVLSGVSELILSVDPSEAIDTVYQGRLEMEKNGVIMPAPFIGDDEWVDSISAFLLMMRGQPDKVRTRAALGHFQAMIQSNKKFWTAVAEETDNDREWLPNTAQQSVFDVEVTEEIAASWQEVLGALDDMFAGRTLIPYWRTEVAFDDGVITNDALGINFAKMMKDPKDFDVILMLQGAAIAPYLEKGELMDGRAWRRFERLTGRRSMLFAFWLN